MDDHAWLPSEGVSERLADSSTPLTQGAGVVEVEPSTDVDGVCVATLLEPLNAEPPALDDDGTTVWLDEAAASPDTSALALEDDGDTP